MKKSLLAAAVLAASAVVQAAPTVQFTDFIANGDRSGFNGFESISNVGGLFNGASFPYVEGGIAVAQNNNLPGGIWVTCGTICFNPAPEGNFSWYPNGGDSGYTSITRNGGGNFLDIGFLIGSGWGNSATTVFYELFDDGVSVLTGSFGKSLGDDVSYLGFGGGGFDEVRVRDQLRQFASDNALAIDSIEMRDRTNVVPLPTTLWLVGLSLGLLGAFRKKAAA